jgi:hypothetical protein
MTSARKIASNRANAASSTGPRTASGRARVGQNARRHGLTLPLASDLIAQAEALAHDIVTKTGENLELQDLARAVAEAVIEQRRVRHARDQLLSQILAGLEVEDDRRDGLQADGAASIDRAAMLPKQERRLRAIDRYARRASARERFAVRAFHKAKKKLSSR